MLGNVPMSEASWSEQDSFEFLRARFKRDKTYIIELRKYNEIGELLIENRITGHRDTYTIRTGARGYL